MPEYPLSRELNHARVGVDTLDHAGLAFYRFVPLGLDQKGREPERMAFLSGITRRFQGKGVWHDVAAFHAARMLAAAEAFRAQGRPVEIIEARTVTRLLMGIGYKNALDVGLAFHPAGFPCLTGASVKGLCRAWAEDVEDDTPPALLKRVFGTKSKNEHDESGEMEAGSVCFLDALPLGFPRLDVDLLNPHYPTWYRAENTPRPGDAPADWDAPIPVNFLAVAPGQAFRFLLVGRTESDTTFVKVAAGWLKDALSDLGAGAKTAAGYGYFDTSRPLPRAPERTSAPAALRQPEQARQTAAPASSPDAAPEKLSAVNKNSTAVPAQVTGHKGRMLLVRMHVQEYERDTFEVGGTNGPEFAQVGNWIQVDVAAVNKKSGRVTQVNNPKKQ